MLKIGPSLMCTDLGNVENDIKELDKAEVDFYHIDIMDGQFVPNFTLGPDFVQMVSQVTQKPLDVHLMVENPERFIDMFADSGASMIAVHAEATTNLQGTLTRIRELGLKAGVAINPSTPLDVLDYVYSVVDYVIIMTVNPGFAGQTFITDMYEKINRLKSEIIKRNLSIDIEVDGNIGDQTIPLCVKNGATMFIGGTSSVYKKGKRLQDNIEHMRMVLEGGEK